jgi:hypothetical protein
VDLGPHVDDVGSRATPFAAGITMQAVWLRPQRAFLRYTTRLLTDCEGDEEKFVAWYLSATVHLEDGVERVARKDAH